MGMETQVDTFEEMCDLMCSNKIPRRKPMKNTKYLFDESKRTPEGMVSVSQLQTFMSCKKKWAYNYIDNLKPRVDKSYLTIGKLCHKGMQTAMQMLWEHPMCTLEQLTNAGIEAMRDDYEDYLAITSFLPEEIPDVEQLWVDARSVFTQALEEFDPKKYEVLTLVKGRKAIPALELHFVVPCPPSKGLHGYIDAILRNKETGFTWCVDYKFRRSLSPDEEEAFNIQNAVYSYACMKMGIDITGTKTWQHINTPAADPAILKDGKISRAKIKTTWKHYENFCIQHGQDPEDYYLEMEEKLGDIEWYRETHEYRNDTTIQNIWQEVIVPATRALKSAHNKSAVNYKSMYPWNCKMCQYQSICQAELRDYDVKAIIEREYTRR